MATATGNYKVSFMTAGILLLVGAAIAFRVKDLKKEQINEIRKRLESEEEA